MLDRVVVAYAEAWDQHRYLAELYADHVARGAVPDPFAEGTSTRGMGLLRAMLAAVQLPEPLDTAAFVRGILWLARGSVITLAVDAPALRARQLRTLQRMLAALLDDAAPGFLDLPAGPLRAALGAP